MSKTDLHLGFGFFLHAFVKTPSPTNTRPEGMKAVSKIESFHLARREVGRKCQSIPPPGQSGEHLPRSSLHRETTLKFLDNNIVPFPKLSGA